MCVCVCLIRGAQIGAGLLFPATCSLGGSSKMETHRAALPPRDIRCVGKVASCFLASDSIRQVARLYSARVSRGSWLPAVFALTSLPSPGDQPGADSLWRPPAQGCAAPETPSLRLGEHGCVWTPLSRPRKP